MATSKAPEAASNPSVEIEMESPDGRPWTAMSEAEAFELQTGHGYKRLDGGGKDNAPAASATASAAAKEPTSKDAGSKAASS